jgi:glycosyltransferase involved in cell wall biosynthesis
MSGMAGSPFFSIITVCLNRAEFIETAIQSVLAQNYADLEHIIIDGGSTDGTLEIIKKYPHLRVYSEPDKGVYDAFNKGIALSKGEVLTFLNSDDRWGTEFLTEVKSQFFKNPSLQIVTTDAGIYKYDEFGSWQRYKYLDALPGGKEFFKALYSRGPAINAWFVRRSIFENLGHFNSAYQISADQEFCMRVIIKNAYVQPLHIEAYNYLSHANSLTIHNDPEKRSSAIQENFIIIEKFLEENDLSPYQKKFFRNRYRNLSFREIKQGIRLVQLQRIIKSIKRMIRSLYI